MSFRDQLDKLNACREALKWVGNKTIEEAWETCENSQWMIWVLSKTDLGLTDPLCDIAERVLHLIPEDKRLVCSNAISAARRRANQDELKDAYAAAATATYYAVFRYSAARAASEAAASAAAYADYAARTARDTRASTVATSYSAICIARSAAAAVNAAPAACASDITAYHEEQNNQCNILRKYFTIDQVKEAFNKLVA